MLQIVPSSVIVPAPVAVLGSGVHPVDLTQASRIVDAWAQRREGRSIIVADAHVIVRARKDGRFRQAVAGADLVVPDGVSVARMIGRRLRNQASRVVGRDLMREVCRLTEGRGGRIGLFGGTPEILSRLEATIRHEYPNVVIAYSNSPPFGPFLETDVSTAVADINRADVQVLFVGLGCPKQEIWIDFAKNRLNCPALGVGAAFDFLAGAIPIAPITLQRMGLEWLFRAYTEPKRLGRRYLEVVPKFVFAAAMERIISPSVSKISTRQSTHEL